MRAVALLVAAGRGERLGSPEPKALVLCGGRPLYEWSLDALRRTAVIEHVVIAGPNGLSVAEAEGESGDRGGVTVVPGGAERSHSVRAALAAAPADADVVVVHDAARPLVTTELIEACVAALEGADAAIAAAPLTDTVKESGGDVVERTLDRSRLWAVQTPQVFRRAALERALAQDDAVLAAATDDASLIEQAGGTVRLVASPRWNLKVTTPEDLRVADLLLRDR